MLRHNEDMTGAVVKRLIEIHCDVALTYTQRPEDPALSGLLFTGYAGLMRDKIS